MKTKTINILTMKRTKMIARIKKLPISIFLSIMLFALGCGESVDPTKADIKLDMKATTQLSTINTNARVANTGIEFTAVLIGVTEIEFEFLEGDDDSDDNDSNQEGDDNDSDDDSDDNSGHDDDEIEFEGQFIVDLLEGTSDPDFGISGVIPGVYEEIEVKISPILDDGNSIFVAFTYQTDGMDEPLKFEFASNKEFEFEIENQAGIQLDGNALNQILILFDLDKIFAGVDLTLASKDDDGIIRINSTLNNDLAATIYGNLHSAFDAGEDHDGDHDIDDDSNDDN